MKGLKKVIYLKVYYDSEVDLSAKTVEELLHLYLPNYKLEVEEDRTYKPC